MRYTINTGCCRVTTWSASLGITLSGLMNEDQDTGLNDLNAYQIMSQSRLRMPAGAFVPQNPSVLLQMPELEWQEVLGQAQC